MSLGAGYRYLMSSVARGDGAGSMDSPLVAYYAAAGTPPGRFLGAGLAGLDAGRGVVPGTTVSQEHLYRMLALLQDPVTGEQLGRPPRAGQTAYIDKDGRARNGAKPVAGFDLTFSAPKSVSVAWGLADPATQGVIYAAHRRAVEHVIRYAEEKVFVSRSGKNGVVEEDVRGVVAAAFDHWDSRAGDPQLHTHVVVLNRVQSADGVWRTLDSRGVFRATVGLSEMYNAVLSDYLTGSLGWGWEPTQRRHSPVPKWEVAGIPGPLLAQFSRRSVMIEASKDELVTRFVTAHGRQPTARDVLKLRQQATLATRPDKTAHTLAELVGEWRSRAATVLASETTSGKVAVAAEPMALVAALQDRNDLPLLHAGDLAEEMLIEVARTAVRAVAEKRATFTRSNVFAEVLRELHGVRFADADERMVVVERAVDLGLAGALLISPPELAHTPVPFQRPDNTSRFRPRGHEVYTTSELLDAEARLLDAGRDTDGPSVSGLVAASVCDRPLPGASGVVSVEQARAVCRVVTSGRPLDVLVGAAGTGKSTTMAAVRAAWEREHGEGSVIGLAPSAAAAEVLADVVGIPTENTAKWLMEASRVPHRRAELDRLRSHLLRASPSLRTAQQRRQAHLLAKELDRWSLHRGQLVIVDEASMAGTFELDSLALQARQVGAKVLVVGDSAQLSPVSAGGAFNLLAHDLQDVAQLSEVRRFTHPWERAASLELRHGRPQAVETYLANGRVDGGDRESLLDLLYENWRADIAAGKRSLMIAADAETVLELNTRARADRVAAGQVAAAGMQVEAGYAVGVGDRVVTRRNHRDLSAGRGWVKNGDVWMVTAAHRDGSLTVTRLGGRGQARLPAAYVREHVELGYATTAHRAQGRTVETGHAFVAATTLREPLYVMATRGRQSNRLYVDTMYDPDVATSHEPPDELEPGEVLRAVLAATGADVSATQTIAEQWDQAHSITRLWAEYDTIARTACEDRYAGLLAAAGVSPEQLGGVLASAAWGPLMATLRQAEAAGLEIAQRLPDLVQGRSLAGLTTSPPCCTAGSADGSMLLTRRVEGARTVSSVSSPPRPPWTMWTSGRRWRIAGG